MIEKSKINIEDTLAAKERFKKICYVCKNCDGRDCPTGVPGMGGTGTGESFKRNIASLKKYKINTRLIHDVTQPNTATKFMDLSLSLPVMAAPITGTVTNMGGAIDELDYNRAVINGCLKSGTLAFVGDGRRRKSTRSAFRPYPSTAAKAFPSSNPAAIITTL